MRTLWRKDVVQWQMGKTLYLSVPFTWLLPRAEEIASKHKGPVVAGGPAVDLAGAPAGCEAGVNAPFDVLSLHNPLATRTTLGCDRGCSFCGVHKIEGRFQELDKWKPMPVVCDSNFLMASRKHRLRVVEALRAACWKEVDFNQGLDCRLFDVEAAADLAHLPVRPLRFSMDGWSFMSVLADALAIAKPIFGARNITVYVLVGDPGDTHDDALARLDFVHSLGVRPFPMRYQPLTALVKNAYLPPDGFTREQMYKLTQYWTKLRLFDGMPYRDFDPHSRRGLPLFDAERT